MTSEANRTVYVSENGADVLVMEMVHQRAQVSAGTVEKLLERLADENRQDPKYVDCILLTYRFFMDALQLFEQLYLRYAILIFSFKHGLISFSSGLRFIFGLRRTRRQRTSSTLPNGKSRFNESTLSAFLSCCTCSLFC